MCSVEKEVLEVFYEGKFYKIESIEQAQKNWDTFRETTGKGVSEIGNGVLLYKNGVKIGYISYNGRVWFE